MHYDVKGFYDQLAANYHLIFEDWDASIRRQGAVLATILERECGKPNAVRVLDCACGIGTQALGLAERGFHMTGCDFSLSAVERARAEADKRGLNIEFLAADLRDLSAVPEEDFDAVICMDNALPHFESEQHLLQALAQIRIKLRTGGVLMASIRDYDTLVQEKPTVQRPAFYGIQGNRRIVHQVWDWTDGRRYTLHLYITREVQHGWEVQHYVSNYHALLRSELSRTLEAAGFTSCRWLSEAESGFYQRIVLAKTP